MSYWFYQISQGNWEPERFRIEIWENERWSWTVGKLTGDGEPQAGDSVAFFYARAQGPDPGFYGWAVVLEYHKAHDESKTLYFRPVAPTDHLKMHPWWDDEAEELAKEVRGGAYQGTLWRVSDEQWRRIRKGITKWLGGRQSEIPSRAATAD